MVIGSSFLKIKSCFNPHLNPSTIRMLKLHVKRASFTGLAFYPNPTSHGFHLSFGNVQSKSLGFRMMVKHLSDFKHIIPVFVQIYPQTVILDRKDDVSIPSSGLQRDLWRSIRIMIFERITAKVVE